MVNGGPLNGVYVGNGLDPGNYGEDEWHIFNSYTNGAKMQYDDPCEDQSQPAEGHLYLSNSDGLAWSSDPLPLSSACSNDNDDPAEDPASTSDAIIELVMRMVVLVKLQQSSASGSAAHPTADTPFDSPVLAPADYVDDLVTPATTPDSDRSVSPPSEKASLRCLSPDSPPTNQPNANRISTVVQEEEPASSAPQVKDSVDELTAQSAEEPSSAATTTTSGPGAGQSTIDKATHGLESGNSAFRRAPAIDASLQEADGSTKIELYKSSGKIIPKNGPTNKRARDEEDNDTNEPTSMTNKKVKTTNVTNDTEAGPASTFGNATSTNGSAGQIPATANGLGAYDVDAGEMPAQELVLDGLASGLGQASDTFVPTVGPTAAPPSSKLGSG
ncbi:hypothetical protein FA13DRAFT_644128 [Coprinellus micaceus]|uniref:Uncharacterized protein n=1 Tax=Coprinellus micaceus TaxID=71717 RepID=A0A4Y7T5L9_COPMI|nr:hypothetical protein FA13DRAFT_644128 [Coprinellus micaceus]